MKKLIFIALLAFTFSHTVFASVLDSKFDDGSLSPQYYEVTKANPDIAASIMLFPLGIDINSRELATYYVGADAQFYFFNKIGVHGSGSKSLLFMNFSDDAGMDEQTDFSNLRLEGGISYAFFSKSAQEKYPLILGSRMTGYNTQTDYYVNIKMPTRSMASVRTGYMLDTLEYNVNNYSSGKQSYTMTVNTVYAGIEYVQSRSAEVLISQEDIVAEFGSKFKKKEFVKLYLDAMYAVGTSGNINTGNSLGFRAGLMGTSGLVSYKVEGGYSPADEFFGRIAAGIGISFFKSGEQEN